MFCHKCGNKSIEGSAFCQKCGERLIVDSTAQQDSTPQVVDIPVPVNEQPKPAEPSSHQMPAAPTIATPVVEQESTHEIKKKTSSKKIIGIAAILGVIIVTVIIAIIASAGGGVDHIATVREHRPFAANQGINATYGAVFDRFITTPEWGEIRLDNAAEVDIRGNLRGSGEPITIVIRVVPNENDPTRAVISPLSVFLDGERTSAPDEAAEFLLFMFDAYDRGLDRLPFDELFAAAGTELIGRWNIENHTADGELWAFNTLVEFFEDGAGLELWHGIPYNFIWVLDGQSLTLIYDEFVLVYRIEVSGERLYLNGEAGERIAFTRDEPQMGAQPAPPAQGTATHRDAYYWIGFEEDVASAYRPTIVLFQDSDEFAFLVNAYARMAYVFGTYTEYSDRIHFRVLNNGDLWGSVWAEVSEFTLEFTGPGAAVYIGEAIGMTYEGAVFGLSSRIPESIEHHPPH